jgi:peptidoglycan L-alanyl-D-glutamate endopeptidase CwlK
MAADEITLERIKLLHPKVRAEVLKAYNHANDKLLGRGVRLRFAYTLRSIDEQNALYAEGRTKLFDSKGKRLGIVTNAKGGQSMHNYGLAFDIVIMLDKDNNGIFETASWNTKADNDKDGTADWMEVVNYFKSLGWKWGGDFNSIVDPPHLEKTFGLSSKELLAKYNAGKIFTENIDSKTYKWVTI